MIAVARSWLVLTVLLLATLVAPGPQALARAATTKVEAPKIAASLTMTASFASLEAGNTCDATAKDPSYLFVAIKNEGNVALAARTAKLLAPTDLKLCPATPVAANGDPAAVALPEQAIAPDRSIVLPLRIAVKDGRPPRTGTVPLVVELHLTRADDARIGDDRLAADKIDLEVPGLTDALKLFGVPTLLLLPGAIVLGAIGLRYTNKDAQWLNAGNATFWIVSILISLTIALVYGWIASRWGHNLVDRYDLRDVGIIWALSVLAGAVWGWLLRRSRDAASSAAAASVPRADDTPRVLLDRLKLLNKTLVDDWYVSTTTNTQGFLLAGPQLARRWLIPRITCAPPATDREAVLDAFDKGGSGPTFDPAAFLGALAAAAPGATLDLGWAEGRSVYEVPDTEGLAKEVGTPTRTFTTR
jgi:hypothetical protein